VVTIVGSEAFRVSLEELQELALELIRWLRYDPE
jgi:hypothetical protein